jgi:hypothetical protein
MASKSAKSAIKARHARQSQSEPQAVKEITRSGRERRPSEKIAARSKFVFLFFLRVLIPFKIVLEQHDEELLRAQKEERRELRKKKALQKANQLAELSSDGEGEYEPRATPKVSSV